MKNPLRDYHNGELVTADTVSPRVSIATASVRMRASLAQSHQGDLKLALLFTLSWFRLWGGYLNGNPSNGERHPRETQTFFAA